MKIFGLTGSIGMGKSTASRLLRRLRVYTHSSDEAVHALLSPHGKAFRDVALKFPEAWDRKTHTINRKILGDIVFASPQKKAILEGILHPLVQASQAEFVRRARRIGARAVALDIPLLFETGAQTRVQKVITVTAPHFVQRHRVLKRAGYSEQKFDKILRTQMPDQLKRKLSDHVVHTGLGQNFTLRQLQKILKG